MQTLEKYFSKGSGGEGAGRSRKEGEVAQGAAYKPNLATDLPEAYLLGAGYDGEEGRAFLKLYEPNERKIYVWYDDSGHKPYCLSKEPLEKLRSNQALIGHEGLERLEEVEKYDALKDETIKMTKIVAKDPLSIGGRPSGSIRDLIKSWEADIKYTECYIYDRGLVPGMPYRVEGGKLIPVKYELEASVLSSMKEALKGESEEYLRLSLNWAKLLECQVPEFLRAAVDIEVYSPLKTRVPSASEAEHPVICASIAGIDGKRKIFLLEREGVREGGEPLPEEAEILYFDDEKELLLELFKAMLDYPVILTFNGDDFDLKYLYHRARNLGLPKETIPIELSRDSASVVHGIHVDLYKFFFNRSIQVYAFGQKYRENTLDDVAKALIQIGKKEIQKPVPELTYSELAAYCLMDALITLRLTTFNDGLVMKLAVALSRISATPLEDVIRQGVSNWIKSMIYNEHRKRGYLIPRPDDILSLKGVTVTKAAIKGKKYKGAIVVEPVQGIHFNVAVLDFASLYPSIIKVWNLGYETILCPHEGPECRENKVPGTTHWVCRKRRALESLVIGSLRDLRVKWYKPKSKDKNLPEGIRNFYFIIQSALKVVLNASYGVFGAETFALYCPPVAEATAAIGRFIITKAIKRAGEVGMGVIYGDTDSIFLGGPREEQLRELMEWSKRELKMELEVDKWYRYVALSSRKKNYFGVYEDGAVDIKGLTGKKRHIPEFLKRAFYEMIQTLSQVKTEEEFQEAKEKIKQIVKDCYFNLKFHRYSLEDLAFKVMISKPPKGYVKTTPQHVKAAQLLENSGVEVKPGDLISFVKVVGEAGVKPVNLASVEEVDTRKYVEYIKSTFEQVLDALGTSLDELIGHTKLEAFFG
ncbi:TPA: DNA-directed DNA polymerase I [Candidatus Bathyarchaeota archaeon]|nr:DNA-directed DNA polymerase I [Candidatus Bathyarchaeota archaeon]